MRVILVGAMLLLGTVLAGCTGQGDAGSPEQTGTTTTTDSTSTSAAPTTTTSTTTTATVAPVNPSEPAADANTTTEHQETLVLTQTRAGAHSSADGNCLQIEGDLVRIEAGLAWTPQGPNAERLQLLLGLPDEDLRESEAGTSPLAHIFEDLQGNGTYLLGAFVPEGGAVIQQEADLQVLLTHRGPVPELERRSCNL